MLYAFVSTMIAAGFVALSRFMLCQVTATIRVVKIGLPVHAVLELAEGAAKVRHGVVQVAGVGEGA